MNMLLAFYIVGAVLNCVRIVALAEAFTEGGKSRRVCLVATRVLTLLSLSAWVLGAVVIGCEIASRVSSGEEGDYDDGGKHGTE